MPTKKLPPGSRAPAPAKDFTDLETRNSFVTVRKDYTQSLGDYCSVKISVSFSLPATFTQEELAECVKASKRALVGIDKVITDELENYL